MSSGDRPFAGIRVRSTDDASESRESPISLVDATNSQPSSNEGSRNTSPFPGAEKIQKTSTIPSVRERLAKKKYAKWQEGRDSYQSQDTSKDENEAPKAVARSGTEISSARQTELVETPADTETADFASQRESGGHQQEVCPETGKRPKQMHKERPSEIDILYENQRGLFFFGIPLYAHSSLLNFDPAPWITKEFKDSAVNITNAQVPDPSWDWAWKSWYVDMSYDVDEEGWQYSFSFGKRWAWHGTHPWFHSYVRRRRWLRKRVKKHNVRKRGTDGSMSAAHLLTSDYFTIHTKRDLSPTSPMASTARTSYLSQRTAELKEPPEEIQNVLDLLRTLKLATIDREKIDAVNRFVEKGSEELAYLEDKIPEITAFLVFQTSRRQLLELLEHAADDAQKRRDEHDADIRPEDQAEQRRIDHLRNAARAAEGQIRGLEYWSDRKHVLKTSDESGHKTRADDDLVHEIRGISDKAELEVDPTHHAVHLDHEDEEQTVEGKGKGKARSIEDDQDGTREYTSTNSGEPSNRLPADSIMVKD